MGKCPVPAQTLRYNDQCDLNSVCYGGPFPPRFVVDFRSSPFHLTYATLSTSDE